MHWAHVGVCGVWAADKGRRVSDPVDLSRPPRLTDGEFAAAAPPPNTAHTDRVQCPLALLVSQREHAAWRTRRVDHEPRRVAPCACDKEPDRSAAIAPTISRWEGGGEGFGWRRLSAAQRTRDEGMKRPQRRPPSSTFTSIFVASYSQGRCSHSAGLLCASHAVGCPPVTDRISALM